MAIGKLHHFLVDLAIHIMVIFYSYVSLPEPSGNLLHSYLINGPVETVSFPIHGMVMFHSYVAVYQSVHIP